MLSSGLYVPSANYTWVMSSVANGGAWDNVAVATVACNVTDTTSVYAIGTTYIGCTAYDTSGNVGTCSFSVRVANTHPPVLTCPNNTFYTLPLGDTFVNIAWTLPLPFDLAGIAPPT